MIDTHAHLMFRDFKDDLPEVLKRAEKASVTEIVNVGCTISDSLASFSMSKKYKNLYGTLGVHPYDAAVFDDAVVSKFFEQAKGNKKIVAIGECGLDYHRERHDETDQKRAFRMHLALANELSLPVIIHSRDAATDTLEVLKEFSNARAVFHCYPYDLDYAKELWDISIFTSFTGVITYPKNDSASLTLYDAPLDKIMIETDCPFLAPQKYRGKRNEPSYVGEVLAKIAEIKGLDIADVDKAVTGATREFFRI